MPLAILETVQEDCALGDQLSVQIEQLDVSSHHTFAQFRVSESSA